MDRAKTRVQKLFKSLKNGSRRAEKELWDIWQMRDSEMWRIEHPYNEDDIIEIKKVDYPATRWDAGSTKYYKVNERGEIESLREKDAKELLNRGKGKLVDTFAFEKEFESETKLSASDHRNLRKEIANIKQIPDSQLTSREKSIQDLGKQLGVPVVFFEGNKNLHGYFAGGTSFINRNSATSLEWTFWHESFHAMQAQNPNLYNQILSEIKKSQSFTDKQIDAYRKEIGAFSLSDDEVIEEMLADNMQDAAKRSGIIDSLRGNRNLFQKFVDFVRDLYNQVKDYFNSPKTSSTLQRIN